MTRRTTGSMLKIGEVADRARVSSRFRRHAESPEAAIRSAIRSGGDTDTVAAMTGALAGARHGYAGMPASWTVRLEAGPRLHRITERLTRDSSASGSTRHGPPEEQHS